MGDLRPIYRKVLENSEKDYQGKKYYWKTKASPLASLLEEKLKPESTILDIGTGEGRDAMLFAKKGHRVTAVDFSQKGIEKAKKRAEKHNLHIDFLVENITDPKFIENLNTYDAIIANNILHFLTPEDAQTVLNYIKKQTKIEGYVAIASLIGITENLKRFKPFELHYEFKSWKKIHYQESEGISRNGEMCMYVGILAKKLINTATTIEISEGPKPWDD